MSEKTFDPLKDNPDERWLPVVGYEGLYEVSDLGRIISIPRRRVQARFKAQFLRNTYLTVTLCGKMHYVHRLVLTAFVGPCPDGMESLHRDGERQNNRLDNLRWGTNAENVEDKIAHGRWRKAMDALRPLTPDQEEFIRRNYKVIKQVELARMFGVSRRTIQTINVGGRRPAQTLRISNHG